MTSAVVEAHLDCYFESLNSITKKITQDIDTLKKGLGEDNWDRLTVAEQEDILERYLVDPQIKQKYSYVRVPHVPQVFPTMKIKCGEKIVVDFENDDGWTWTDEHSGPFSWMSRSQQDLTLDDLDGLDDPAQKKSKARGRSRSPDRIESKSWETNYSAAPDHGKKANPEAAHTADEIFQKFGIAFSFGTEENDQKEIADDEVNAMEKLKLSQGQHYQNFSILLEEQEKASTVSSYVSTPAEETKSELDDDDDDDDADAYSLSKETSTDDYDDHSQKESKDRHNSQQRSFFINTSHRTEEDEEGEEEHYQRLIFPSGSSGSFSDQASPVSIEQPGESSTDRLFTSDFVSSDIQANSPAVFGSNFSQHQVITQQPATSSDWSLTEKGTSAPSEEDVQKTGFDFLDNW